MISNSQAVAPATGFGSTTLDASAVVPSTQADPYMVSALGAILKHGSTATERAAAVQKFFIASAINRMISELAAEQEAAASSGGGGNPASTPSTV